MPLVPRYPFPCPRSKVRGSGLFYLLIYFNKSTICADVQPCFSRYSISNRLSVAVIPCSSVCSKTFSFACIFKTGTTSAPPFFKFITITDTNGNPIEKEIRELSEAEFAEYMHAIADVSGTEEVQFKDEDYTAAHANAQASGKSGK